jgi:hypothetical protein
VATVPLSAEFMYHVEQRKLEQLQHQFRCWLETKEDIVRLADKRDQLLAVLNEKYGYRAETAGTVESAEV